MPTTTITVSYVNGAISASPTDPKIAQGANVIQWVPGTGISSINSISGLPNPPFTPPQCSNNGCQSTDTNNVTTATTYNYSIGYTLSDLLTTGTHDPQITNEPT